jgi:membrane protease YdiL (CAAX protease family)
MLVRRLFITEDHRPALLWRVAGYAGVFGGILMLRGPLGNSLERAAATIGVGVSRLVLAELVVAVLVTGATLGLTLVWRRFVDRRPWAGMALPCPWRRGGDVAAGFVLGAAMILVVFAVEYGLGWLRVTGLKEGFGGVVLLAVLAARLLHFIATAVCEEVAYRGYLLQNVAERFPLWVAVLATGAVFALSHLAAFGFQWGFVAAGIVASFLLAQMRLLTGAIWLGVGWHLGWDWVEDGVGLVPGYSTLRTEQAGPPLWAGRGLAIEGGLLVILVLAAGLTALLAWSWCTGRVVDWRARLTADGAVRARRAGPGGQR